MANVNVRRVSTVVLAIAAAATGFGLIRRLTFSWYNGCDDIGIIQPDGSTRPLPQCEPPWTDQHALMWLAALLVSLLALALLRRRSSERAR